MEVAFGESSSLQDVIRKTRSVEEILRKNLTRQGLNLVCKAQKPEDLHRIRANLRDGYVTASKLDARYLGRHGE